MSDKGFDEIEAKSRLLRQAQDQDDLNNEQAGNEVGRIGRFGLEQTSVNAEAKRKQERKSLLEQMLLSAAYSEAYGLAMSALNNAESTAYEALLDVSENLSASEAKLAEIKDKAQELPDGAKVFRAKDGSVFGADGTQIPADQAANIAWNDNAPTWEEHQKAKQARDSDLDRYNKLIGFETELDGIRDRMEDKNNPPSLDDIKGMKQRIAEMQRDAVSAYKAEPEFKATALPKEVVPDLNLDSLKM